MNERPQASQEVLEILHDEGIMQDLAWSKQLIDILPADSPLYKWHKDRFDYWTSRFNFRSELEREDPT